ncbi:hypothetical protein [Castellaniella caeni]|uniref:hypothetical protein n=1 Tax=Castellaniella caeni TaxID=266123 RepID=UPI000C9FC399|nr:hypothetical protein [Castellaniella caeni]
MFPMTITVNDKTQLNAILAALSLDNPAAATTKPETTTKKSTSAQTTEKPAPTQRTAEAGADAAHESKAGNSDAAQSGNSEQPERAVVADAIKKLAPKNRDALVEILAKHGGKHLNDITADKWAALLADLNKALA